jgi:hypothetical protein
VDESDRDDEAQPVGRGQFTAAPVPRQGDGGLVREETAVGRFDGVRSQLVGLDPFQAALAERRHVAATDCAVGDVAGVREQRCADRHGHVAGSIGSAGGLDGSGEAGPGGDLEQHLG